MISVGDPWCACVGMRVVCVCGFKKVKSKLVKVETLIENR